MPVPVTKQLMESLHEKGLIRLFKPTAATLNPAEGTNIGESLYESDPQYGPHKLIAVGVNKTTVRLGVHPDHEEFLIPDFGSEVRPLYLVISHISQDELLRRDQAGTLAASDFTCLSLYPSPRGAEMFTMLAGTVHCELTDVSSKNASKPFGVFYVTESRDLPITWVDLEHTEVKVE